MNVYPAAAKASVKIVPTALLSVMVYREVTNSPVTIQSVATAFAGVCGLWLVGAVVSSRDATRELRDTINDPEHGILARMKAMADVMQAHEQALGSSYSQRHPKRRKPE